jgi:hypothetical protein
MYSNRKKKWLLIGIASFLVIAVVGFFGIGGIISSPNTQFCAQDMGPKTAIYQGLTDLDIVGEAVVVITAPKEVKLGKLVVLDVSESTGNKFKWMVVPETEDFLVIDDGRRAVFSSGVPGEYMFIVACAAGDSVDVKRHIVRILSISPPPPIDPIDPVSPPNPTRIMSELGKKVTSWCVKVQSPTRSAEARQLADGFESVASQIDAGILTSAYEIIQSTTDAHKGALGDRLQVWIPFLRGLQAELEQRADNRTLVSPAQHSVAWKEIAKGLRYFAAQ